MLRNDTRGRKIKKRKKISRRDIIRAVGKLKLGKILGVDGIAKSRNVDMEGK